MSCVESQLYYYAAAINWFLGFLTQTLVKSRGFARLLENLADAVMVLLWSHHSIQSKSQIPIYIVIKV